MNLSILIFVLSTIVYEYQCAPTPNWVEDLQQSMQKMTQEMHERQLQLDESLQALELQTQNLQKNFEEQMKQLGHLPNNVTNGLQDPNGMNTNTVSGHSTISTSSIVNGNRVDKTIVENVIDNVKYRTETKYSSATGKTEIKKYECNPPSSPCILKTTEVKDGPPENFY